MKPRMNTRSRIIAGFAVIACLQLTAVSTLAAPVAPERAQAVAANWILDQTGIAHEALPDFDRSVAVAAADQVPAYYVLNMNPGGWVIVAADDAAYPIIAYSPDGTAQRDDAPPAYLAWMSKVNDSIRAAAHAGARRSVSGTPSSDPATTLIAAAWSYLDVVNFQPPLRTGNALGSTVLTAVAPLLATTWSQGTYYNQFCPADNAGPDRHALVGCCATAFGQILRYYSHPATGNGSHSYYHPTYGTLSANFGTTTYNWAAIPTAGSLSTYNSAAATVLSQAGIALDMDYGPSGSGCYPAAIAPAFRNYFRYLADNIVNRSAFSDAAWIAKIKTDLDARRPVFYVGYGSGGHAFVLDGYNDSNYFHFNWGWNGAYDGYFLISNLNPAGYNFNSNQAAVFNIRPATAPPTAPAALAATASSTSQINLTWTDTSSNETGFRIERKTGVSGTYAEIAAPAANATSFSNTGLAAGTTYYYRVWAYNAGGNSAYSNEAPAVTFTTACSSAKTAISAGSTLGGTLATTDCRSTVRSPSYYDNFTFAVAAGTTYTITMNSKAFDAFLYLLNGASVLAANDSGDGSWNSKIVYTATTSGTLTIHATSLSGGTTGAYTVSLAGGAGCTTTPIGVGSTSGTLAKTDCRSSVRAGSFYDNPTFPATAGTTYTITLSSAAFDAYLFLLNSAGGVLASNDDYNGFNSRIVYRATTSGTLTIHATTYSPGATGAYSVTRN